MAGDDDAHQAEQTITLRPGSFRPLPPTLGHYLVFADGGSPRRVAIGPDGLTIGRVPPSTLVINSPDISRRHCRIDLDGDWVVVADLGSTNGTFHGGERVEKPTRLRNGSILNLGAFQIRYERRDQQEVIDEASLTADLRRASDYVRAILPQPIMSGPVLADWHFVPSSQLGGDAFGYQFLDDRTFAGFLLDVSGHGIGSAMHAANVANAIRRRALPGVDFSDPAQVAAGLNDVFPMEEHNGLMLTLSYFVYDLPTRQLRFCAAGHHAAYLRAPDNDDPAPLSQRGPAIGMLPVGRWAVGTMDMPQGARLYVFSDGAFEVFGADGREWTIEDLRRLIGASPAAPESEAQRVYQAVRGAVRPGPLEDDFSLLVLEFQ